MRRPIAAVVALLTSFMLASVLTVTTNDTVFSESYPEVVCPPTLGGVSSQLSVPSKKIEFQSLESRSGKTKPLNVLRYPVAKSSLILAANGVTPVIWQSRAGSWAGGTLCTGPITSQWFVGGSSDIRSRGRLILVNSGLSEAIIDLNIYSENGKQPLISINLKSKSYNAISLDSLATGDRSLTVQVVPRSGRINAFMIDELGTGLKALGGDFVNPTDVAAKTLIIPAIPNQIPRNGGQGAPVHKLRILTTNEVDARFTLELLSDDGRFIPVGFNSKKIFSGVVTELLFSPKIRSSSFAVRITADEPIVAAISSHSTINGRRDFVWSTPTPPLTPMTLAATGLAPLFVFTADSIVVDLEVTLINGKSSRKQIRGSGITTWRTPDSVRSIRIIQSGPETYAGALVTSSNGYGYIPISQGSLLTKVEVGRSNIRVLNP